MAVGHPLITVVHQIVELLTPQRRLRRFRARHRAQRRRRRYAERRLFPFADPGRFATYPLLPIVDKKQSRFQPLQGDGLQAIGQRERFTLLNLLEKRIDRHAVGGFNELIFNVPALVGQGQRFTIQQQARRYRRERRHWIAGAAQLDTQTGVSDCPSAAAEGHHQAMMQPHVTGDAEILVVTGDLPVVEALLRRCRPCLRARQHRHKKEKDDAKKHEPPDPR